MTEERPIRGRGGRQTADEISRSLRRAPAPDPEPRRDPEPPPAQAGSGVRYVEEITDPVTGEMVRVEAQTLDELDRVVAARLEACLPDAQA